MKSLACLLVLVVASGCLADQGIELTKAEGTIRFIALEGGFFGIIGSDGAHYDPVNLATAFQQDGLRVRFTAKPAKSQVSFHMWGQMVEVITIEKL
jgi:inhibitor of cysteine peptidase